MARARNTVTAASRRRAVPRSGGWIQGSPRLDPLLLRLHASTDLPQFWSALQEILTATTPYDALIVYLNFLDFATSWQATQILATPNAQRPTKWFQNRREVDMTPQFVLSQPKKLKIYRLSDVVPNRRELERSAFFQEFLALGGWHHLAVVLYWRGGRVGSEIALRRTALQGDFSDAEIALLEALYPHIEVVLNRLLTLEEERARRRSLESFNHHLPFALMYLNWERQPLHVNQAGLELCALWNHGPAKARAYRPRTVFSLPPEILQACAELKAVWLQRPDQRSSGPLAAVTVVHPNLAGLVATIRLHVEERARAAYPGYFVYLENRMANARSDTLAGHSLLGQLSVAERAIARSVCEGLGNAEIARRLGKSVKTVKGQLTSIYSKLNVAGRTQLVLRLR